MKFDKSVSLVQIAGQLTPEQTLTVAKIASIFLENCPKYKESTSGFEVVDIVGNKYID